MQLSNEWMNKSNENAKLNSDAASRATKGKEVAGSDLAGHRPQTGKFPTPVLGPANRPQSSISDSTVGHPSRAPIANMIETQFSQDPDRVLYDGDTPVQDFDKEATVVSG